MVRINSVLVIISCFIILIVTSDCKREKSSVGVLTIDVSANVYNRKRINLSELSDNIRYVHLKSRIEHPLTRIAFFDVSGQYILLSDMRICLLYDNAGNYIRQIGKQGRGPGEYVGGISSISLIDEGIYIRDFLGYDLIEYNTDGTFIKRHKDCFLGNSEYRLEDAVLLNDSLIFGNVENRSGQEEYKALIVDKQGDIRYYYKNYFRFNLESGNESVKSPVRVSINRFTDKLFFKEHYDDTLFQLDGRYILKPAYIFSLGKYKEPLSEAGKKWDQRDLFSYIDLRNVYQTENLIILDCDFNKYSPARRITPEIINIPGFKDVTMWINTSAVIGIYDKKSGELVFSEPTSTDNHLFTSGLYNDIDAGPRFYPEKQVNDSTMAMWVTADHLKKHIASDDFKNGEAKHPEKKKELEKLANDLSEFDNPVLMLVTFRK